MKRAQQQRGCARGAFQTTTEAQCWTVALRAAQHSSAITVLLQNKPWAGLQTSVCEPESLWATIYSPGASHVVLQGERAFWVSGNREHFLRLKNITRGIYAIIWACRMGKIYIIICVAIIALCSTIMNVSKRRNFVSKGGRKSSDDDDDMALRPRPFSLFIYYYGCSCTIFSGWYPTFFPAICESRIPTIPYK